MTAAPVLALAVAACNGSQARPPLADAKAIITATLSATEAAKSVHAEIGVDGKAAVALPVGGTSGAVDLTGTTISADVDIAGSDLHATFAVPGVLNLSGELIVVDGDAYLRSSITGPKFRSVDLRGVLPVDPTKPGALVDQLGDFLLTPGVDPVKGPDASCGAGRCYTVTVDLDPTELTALTGTTASGLPIDLTGASFKLTMQVEQALPYHLSGLAATLTMADGNAVTMDARFSKWDEPVSVSPPPLDKVAAPG